MTIKLYDLDAYQTEFEAQVITCIKKDQYYDVVLDQTLFFPEEGGQMCDQGTLNDIAVEDVQIIDDIIHHYVSQSINGKVKGCIDFSLRFDQMQNHSGEHILSGIVHNLFGYDNVGFHLSLDTVTADFNGMLTPKQIEDIENRVNQAIYENRVIKTYYPEYPQDIDYRSKKEIDGDIRIVEIDGVDLCACCAPHVLHTGEIGLFKITKAMKHRGGMRLTFVCGKRALTYVQTLYQQASSISVLLSKPIEQVYEGVLQLNNDNMKMKHDFNEITKTKIIEECQSLTHQSSYLLFKEHLDKGHLRLYINELLNKVDDYVAVFNKEDLGYFFLIASHQDARVYLNKLKEIGDVKGGGKPDMVQGMIFSNEEDIKKGFK